MGFLGDFLDSFLDNYFSSDKILNVEPVKCTIDSYDGKNYPVDAFKLDLVSPNVVVRSYIIPKDFVPELAQYDNP